VTYLIHLEKSQIELKLKTALLMSVPHELRAPTTAIVTFSDQIEKSEKSISDEEMEKYWELPEMDGWIASRKIRKL
jgi:K+-sensing histidine kinase KdpD